MERFSSSEQWRSCSWTCSSRLSGRSVFSKDIFAQFHWALWSTAYFVKWIFYNKMCALWLSVLIHDRKSQQVTNYNRFHELMVIWIMRTNFAPRKWVYRIIFIPSKHPRSHALWGARNWSVPLSLPRRLLLNELKFPILIGLETNKYESVFPFVTELCFALVCLLCSPLRMHIMVQTPLACNYFIICSRHSLISYVVLASTAGARRREPFTIQLGEYYQSTVCRSNAFFSHWNFYPTYIWLCSRRSTVVSSRFALC